MSIEDTKRFFILKWILLISNVVSLISDVLVIIFGSAIVKLFASVPKEADEVKIRVFCAIEAVIVIIGIVGIIKKHFHIFTLHCALLLIYFIGSFIFTRILITWFVALAVLLVLLSITFDYFLYVLKTE